MWKVKKLREFDIQQDIVELAFKIPELKGAEDIIKTFQRHINSVVYWLDGEIKSNNGKDTVIIGSKNEIFNIKSNYVAMGLSNCKKATLITVTIGGEISKYSDVCYQEGKYWESIVVDVLGSHAVEILIKKFHKYLIQKNSPYGFHSTLRFSPGYGDWSLSQQKEILTLLKTEDTITVNPHGMLKPIKSITTMVGWSATPREEEYPQGEKNKVFCQGKVSCNYCNTWACKK